MSSVASGPLVEHEDETREELVAAATRVFADRGFHAATLAEVAHEAGCSTDAVREQFGGKDELFLAAFEAYALTRVGELRRIYGHERDVGDLADRARIFADHWMERQADNPDFVIAAFEFFAHSLRHPELREALATRQAAVRIAVARILEEDMAAAGIEPPLPVDEIATVMRELGVGLAMAKLVDPEVARDELYGDFVEVFFRLMLGEDPS
jgi:AcrR family transcriptional regulator